MAECMYKNGVEIQQCDIGYIRNIQWTLIDVIAQLWKQKWSVVVIIISRLALVSTAVS